MRSRRLRDLRTAAIFLAPFVILYSVFTIWPVFQALWVSFSEWSLTGWQGLVGLGNYARAMGDRYFWEALENTAIFTVITVPALMVCAIVLALLANRASRFKAFVRSAFYIPSVLTVSVIAFIARFMASPHTGFINQALHDLGLLPAGVEPQWLQDGTLAWVTLAGTTVWWTVGFAMLLYLAALQEIPDSIYEAAALDGAGRARQLFSLTLPLMARTHWLVFLLQVIACFRVFGQVQLITGGGPAGSTTSLVLYIYQTGFGKDDLGYASAMSFLMFLLLLGVALFQVRVQTRSEVAR